MTLSRNLAFAIVLSLSFFSFACDRSSPGKRSSPSTAAPTRLEVVATTSIIGDWAREVGGDAISLSILVGPDGDPHEFQPSPADTATIGDASLILENGLHLEPWLDRLCSSSGTHATRASLSDGIEARHVEGKTSDVDPHVWQDVKDAMLMVDHLRDAMAAADPSHAPDFKSRAAAYQKKLAELDASIQAQIDSIDPARRKLITSHDTFGYFAQRYGLDTHCSAFESISTETSDPSPKEMASVIEQIRSSGVPVVFLENIRNPKLITRLAEEAHVKVGPPLYTDALGRPGSDGDTYIKMMQHNAAAMTRALK